MTQARRLSLAVPALLAALAGIPSGAAAPAAAADPCGGVSLQSGAIRLGKPLTDAWVGTPEGKACIAAVVQEIDRNRLVRGVTVSMIASDADRVSGKALTQAKAVAAALVAAGFPKGRVFALAPAPQRTETPGISMRYVERAPDDVVARIASAGGQVFLGPDDAQLKPAEPGMPVVKNELVKTGPNSGATIHLKDGSGIELRAETKIRMPVLEVVPGGERRVQIEVLTGEVKADVRKATQASRFEASNRVAVASVRGTLFRFRFEESGVTRVETLEGRVAVSPAADPKAIPVEVPAGSGTLVTSEGRVQPAQVLPEAVRIVSPLKGALPKDARFTWQRATDAVTYRLELARDADFEVERKSAEVQGTTLSWPVQLPPGKWFWRVTALNAEGFASPESKVYAFTVGK